MGKRNIYLIGPIRMIKEKKVVGWRGEAKVRLQGEFECKSFDRCAESDDWAPREIKYIDECDIVFANMWKPSIGTTIGIVCARQAGRPVVLLPRERIKSRMLKALMAPRIASYDGLMRPVDTHTTSCSATRSCGKGDGREEDPMRSRSDDDIAAAAKAARALRAYSDLLARPREGTLGSDELAIAANRVQVHAAIDTAEKLGLQLCAKVGSDVIGWQWQWQWQSLSTTLEGDTYLAEAHRQMGYASKAMEGLLAEIAGLAVALALVEAELESRHNESQDLFEELGEDAFDSPRLEDLWEEAGELGGYVQSFRGRFASLVTAFTFQASGALDRAAQVLSFIYFNTREFDHDTFRSVVERLEKNFVREDLLLAQQHGWSVLRKHRSRESPESLEAMQRRRNTLAHVASFQDTKYLGNRNRPVRHALDRRRLKFLKLQPPIAEALVLSTQAVAVIEAQCAVLELCCFGVESLGLRPFMAPPPPPPVPPRSDGEQPGPMWPDGADMGPGDNSS